MGNPRGEAELFPCPEPRGGCQARCPRGLVAQTRGDAAGCISARSWSQASWCLRGELGLGGACRPLQPPGPLRCTQRSPCHRPAAPSNPTGQRPAPSPTPNPNHQQLQGRKASVGWWLWWLWCCQAAGGHRSVGDVLRVPESPCPLHHPPTLVTASTELPKAPGAPSLGTQHGAERTLPALSPRVSEPKLCGHRAEMWVPRAAAVMGARQWPCCPSGPPTKALPLGCHGSTGHSQPRDAPTWGLAGCPRVAGQGGIRRVPQAAR